MRVSGLKLKVFTIVLFTLFNFAVFAYLFTQAGGRFRLDAPYTFKAVVADPLNLVENSDVRAAGAKVGRVVSRDAQGAAGVVTIEIEERSFAPIYRNATAAPRIKTLVGETYLELDPGTKEAGEIPSGGTLPLAQSQEVVPLERILSMVDDRTREEVQRNFTSLGPGLANHGDDLNRLFRTAQPTVANGGVLMQAIRAQRFQLAHAVDDTATILQTFADRTQQVRSLAVQAKTTAEVVAARDDQMRAWIRELEPTLVQARGSLNKLGGFSGRATPVMRDLRLAMVDLAPTFQDLQPAAADGRRLFAELPDFIDVADPMLDELAAASRDLKPAVNGLDATLRQAYPALRYLSRYNEDVGSFFATAGSAVEFHDALGHIARPRLIFGPENVSPISNNPSLFQAYNVFLEAGLLFEENLRSGTNAHPIQSVSPRSDNESDYELPKPGVDGDGDD